MANPAIRTTGLILKEMKVGENDRLVTVLTEDLGVIRAFSSGSLKLGSKNASATAHLTYSRLYIAKSRDTYRIREAAEQKIFWELRQNIKLLFLASYFCEVAMTLAPKEEPAKDYLRLILNCLHLLNEKEGAKISPDTVKTVFELRCCLYSGYMPDISGCHACGGELHGECRFDLDGGVFYCEECAKSARFPEFETVPSSAVAAIRHILTSPLKKCFGWSLGERSAAALGKASERFLERQSAKRFDTLEFYKTFTQ